MHDLSSELVKNYLDHQAFSFDEDSWIVSEKTVSRFNEIYNAFRDIGASLGKRTRNDLKNDLISMMVELFSEMEVQCNDEYETYFLSELKGECFRLLSEEVTWYTRKSKVSFVKFDREESKNYTLSMQNERHFFGCMPHAVVDELKNLAEPELVRFFTNADNGKVKREDLSVNSGSTVRAMINVLNKAYKSSGVLDALSAYTGRNIHATGMALELSVPKATWWKNSIEQLDAPPSTLYAHLDETISCPKSIVYLSDVKEDNGPTSCYPGAYEEFELNPLQEIIGRVIGRVGNGVDSKLKLYYSKQYHQSVSSDTFRKHFMRLPQMLRFNSHLGWDVMPGSSLETDLENVEKKMTGPAGTFIVFDGARLLHRGGLIEKDHRVALQVIFSDRTLAQRIGRRIKRVFS